MYREITGNIFNNINKFTYFVQCISKDKTINNSLSLDFEKFFDMRNVFNYTNIDERLFPVGKYYRTPAVAHLIVKNSFHDRLVDPEVVENCLDALYKDIAKFRPYFPYREIRFLKEGFNIDDVTWKDIEFTINRFGFLMHFFGIDVTVYSKV